MTDPPEAERRQHKRYLYNIPVSYELEMNGEWLAGKGHLVTVDVSAGGAKVKLDAHIQKGDRLRLRIPFAELKVILFARVVWITPSFDKVVAGLTFEDVTEKTHKLLESLLQTVD